MSGITEIVVVDTADHVGVRVSQGTDMVFVLCRKDAFDGRWYAIASVDTTVRAVKEHAEFGNRDDAATEAAEMLFGLTERFMPVAHRELFGEVKRTPETVLRAMLKAYQEAALDAGISHSRERTAKLASESINLDAWTVYIRNALAHLIAEQPWNHLLMSHILHDYHARLAGERPLDAPPLEAP